MYANHALTALTPVDGRYAEKVTELSDFLSEFALIKSRLVVMTEYVIALAQEPFTTFSLNFKEQRAIRSFAQITLGDAKHVKQLERATNHDVKACERYLRERFQAEGMADKVEWIHFGLTSEDVNNCAYAIMLGRAKAVLAHSIGGIAARLHDFAQQHAALPMLSRTHGQPATPTTLGKEFRVFHARLTRQLVALNDAAIQVKLNSASGNYNALAATFPGVDWPDFSSCFVSDLAARSGCKFELNLFTTQIEPHDTYAELFDLLKRANVVLTDLVQDLWRYVSDDWLVQKKVEGEVGSSIMPHKVNPIDFENAEGNLGLANALLEFFSRKLPVSRLQRDLSDSTVERAFGTALGHCLIAYKAIARGLDKIEANEPVIVGALEDRWEVLTEYYQTVLRREGYPDPYSVLKGFARGKHIGREDCMAFIDSLDIDDEVKEEMRTVTPLSYIGLAAELVRL